MQKLTQVRFVTENYELLQGLRMVPLGLWFLVMAIGELAKIPFLRQGHLDYPLLLLIAVGGFYWWLGQYYAHNYGQVVPQSKDARERYLVPLLLFIAGIAGVALDVLFELPVSFLAIVLSVYFFVPFVKALPLLRLHYAIISLVLLLLSLLPLFVEESLRTAFFARSGTYFLIGVGLALIVVGIVDHLWLLSVMQPEQGAA